LGRGGAKFFFILCEDFPERSYFLWEELAAQQEELAFFEGELFSIYPGGVCLSQE